MLRVQKKALLSVYDKTGLEDFAESLISNGFEIISSGGTAERLKKAGIEVQKVKDVTGFPEILDGRVKTLHPKVHGGVLFELDKHEKDMKEHALPRIDLVAVNLYPFKEVIGEEHELEEAIEQIDIGGVALLRAAAKNHERVAVICSPDQYDDVIEDIEEEEAKEDEQAVSHALRKDLAVEAFRHTMDYDTAIYKYLQERFIGEELPKNYHISGEKVQDLRYGENPNQKAAFYRTEHTDESSLLNATKHHGKELSYNNIQDLDAALNLVKEFEEPTVAAIKHTNPTGVGTAEDLSEAYRKAYECDDMSIFGGIVSANRTIPLEMAEMMNEIFLECVIAPGYEPEALEKLKNKKNLRIMELDDWNPERRGHTFSKVTDGLLVQTVNDSVISRNDLEVVSDREPTEDEIEAMLFGWRVIKHVKSNSIIFTRKDRTVGMGAGQMSRVDAVKLAKMKAQLDTEGATMASDAFFPFRDGIDEAAEAGITSVIQPGGSIRDDEVIEAVNEHDMSMVFTGNRVFKH